MANQTAGNPAIFDTTGSLSGLKYIRQIQWVDDAADIADDADMVLTINGVTFTHKLQHTNNAASSTVFYNAGPFNPGLPVTDFTVTTLDAGTIVVWLD